VADSSVSWGSPFQPHENKIIARAAEWLQLIKNSLFCSWYTSVGHRQHVESASIWICLWPK